MLLFALQPRYSGLLQGDLSEVREDGSHLSGLGSSLLNSTAASGYTGVISRRRVEAAAEALFVTFLSK